MHSGIAGGVWRKMRRMFGSSCDHYLRRVFRHVSRVMRTRGVPHASVTILPSP
jgi:hypothetical protein